MASLGYAASAVVGMGASTESPISGVVMVWQ